MISIITTIIIIIAFVYLRAKAVDAVSFSSIITTTTNPNPNRKQRHFKSQKRHKVLYLPLKCTERESERGAHVY